MILKEQRGFSAYDNVKIQCPYCFKYFTHDRVDFRVPAVSPEKVKELTMRKSQAFQNDDKAAIAECDRQLALAEIFSAKTDRILLNYWKDMGWDENAELYEVGDGYSEYSEIDDDAKRLNQITDPVAECDSDMIIEKIYDSSGFITGCRDNRNEVSERRICHYCHNKLPKNYGKNPIYFLAVVGISGAGKTVMLSKLLEKIEDLVANIGFTATVNNKYTAGRYVKKYKIEQNKAMPEGTNKTQFKPPIFLNIVNREKAATVVIYDIAGENCVNPDKINVIGPFVKNANGIIMLLDPEQINGWEFPNRGEQNKAADDLAPQAVINTMANAFLCDEDHKANVPLAVTISKSDLLKNVRVNGNSLKEENSNIFRNVRYTTKAFMFKDFLNINHEVRELIGTYCPALFTAIENLFKNPGFFAVSTLGHDTENEVDSAGKEKKVMRMNIEHTRLEEPLLWLLYRWNVVKAEANGGGKTDDDKDERSLIRRLFGGKR